MIQRRQTRAVKVGNLIIGGKTPVGIPLQSMTNTKTGDRDATLAQILSLEKAGCEIVRVTVNDMDAVKSIAYLKEHIHIPLVADIHFNYTLALEAAAAGIDKIRINPGNIGSPDRVKLVADACRARGIPIRIGINSGSLEPEILAKYGSPTPEALCESGIKAAGELERHDFSDIILSVKSSDVLTMIRANRLLAEKSDYPLHIGVTETGTVAQGSIKSAIGIGSLLADGIGDTLRVSLTGTPEKEIEAGSNILHVLGLRGGINLISCPTCGRTGIDLIPLAEQLQLEIDKIQSTKQISVALMGCVVNGPGEARGADVGVAAGVGQAVLFRKGEVVGKIPEDKIVETLLGEIKKIVEQE